MDETYFDYCKEDATCGGTFGLCFFETSVILECDKDWKATEKEWVPT